MRLRAGNRPLRRTPLEILLLAWDVLDDWLTAGLQLLRRLP
jgi:hypothetical protein